MKQALSIGYRHRRESGGPELAPGLNRGQPHVALALWIPAFAGMTINPLIFRHSFVVGL